VLPADTAAACGMIESMISRVG